jgi:hypothetical protein
MHSPWMFYWRGTKNPGAEDDARVADKEILEHKRSLLNGIPK